MRGFLLALAQERERSTGQRGMGEVAEVETPDVRMRPIRGMGMRPRMRPRDDDVLSNPYRYN